MIPFTEMTGKQCAVIAVQLRKAAIDEYFKGKDREMAYSLLIKDR
jgi:hypothetical protein